MKFPSFRSLPQVLCSISGAALVALSVSCGGGKPATPAAAADILGTVWQVTEELAAAQTWQATWTRKGPTSIFDGVWKAKDKKDITAELQVEANTERVIARRTKSPDGAGWLYSGTFSGPGSISGTVFDDMGAVRGAWKATIGGAGSGRPPVPPGWTKALKAAQPVAADETEARYRVQQVVRVLDPDKPETLDAVEDVVSIGHLAVQPLAGYLTSPNFETRWMSVYGLTRLAEKGDIPGLLVGLKDNNLGLRTGIAATLLRLGDESGLSVLRDAAASEEVLPYSEPPRLLREYASDVLRAYGKLSTYLPSQAVQHSEVRTVSLKGDTDLRYSFAPATLVEQDKGRWRYGEPPKAKPVVNIIGGQVHYWLYIEFYGPGMNSRTAEQQRQLTDRYKKAIESMWSNQLEWAPGRTVSISVYTRVLGPGDQPTPGWDPVQIISVPAGGWRRANSEVWADTDPDAVIAHEAGHLLGLPDEYQDVAGRGSVPKPEYEAESRNEPSIMVQTWDGPNGRKPGAKARHSAWVKEMALHALKGEEWRGWAYPPEVFRPPATTATSKPPVTTARTIPPTTPATTEVATPRPTTLPPTTRPPVIPPATTAVPPTIGPTLPPARDLTGRWTGSGVFYYVDYDVRSRSYGKRVWKTATNIELKLTQTGGEVKGQLTLNPTNGENTGVIPWFRWTDVPITMAVTGVASITNLTLVGSDPAGTRFTWTFTFTTDLMSGGVTGESPVFGHVIESEPKAFSLVRQR
ncbi:MAG: hypothetical protein HYX90_11230 [Chloroflexi bacterium]|nr:hypothetical protein [Chloroflexota bacterium]